MVKGNCLFYLIIFVTHIIILNIFQEKLERLQLHFAGVMKI